MKVVTNQLKALILSILVVSFFASSCGDDNSGKKNETEVSTSDVNEEVPIVCLWSALSIRETPSQKGKRLTTIYLGELATYLGETQTDASNTKKPVDFVKIRLTDGKEGWAAARFMVVNGKPAAITDLTKLYKRPDILSASKNDFEKMQFVVVTEEKDDWVRVKGIERSVNWYREGWVKKDKITEDNIDIPVAILAAKALSKKDFVNQKEAIEDILANTDLSSSQFFPVLRSKLESLNMPSGDEVIE